MKTILSILSILVFSNIITAQTTALADSTFERAIINLGLDSGPIDGQVITANIDTLTYLDISNYNGSDTIFDLTGIEDFVALTYLDCGFNQLTSLNLWNNVNLTHLNCTTNVISNLNISQNTNLTNLDCGQNNFISLDLSQHFNLINFSCIINGYLTCLNLKNGNNLNMNPIWTHYTTNLTCIEVDNATYSTTNWTYIDPASSFSTNCNNNCINPCPIPITSTDTRSECDSLNWINGTTYTSSNNTATFNIAGGADNGCDSIVTLNLTINSTTGTDTRTACDSFTWIDGNTYTSANNTATYNIVNGNSNGCDSLVSLNLTISNLDADFTFTDNGNGNYSFTNTSIGNFNQSHWAFGDGTIDSIANPNHTFTTNGIFTVVLTINDSTLQEDSCISYYIDTINVTGVSNPLPCHSGFAIYPDSTTGDINIVNSSTGFNLTYLWDFGDGNTSTLQNPSHPYATSGPHYLCLTVDDGAGCVDMYCDSIGENGVVFKTGGFTINIIGTPIITELDNHTELNSNINIYPNPTSNQLTINTELKLSEITIIDITGKTMITTKQNTNIINVADLSDGIYFIKLVVEERTITKKFVKQ